MGFPIKIVEVPDGEAPLEVREKWVGAILTCVRVDTMEHALGVVSHRPSPSRRNVWIVPQEEAISALEKIAPEAAKWWRENGYPRGGGGFTFGESEAVICQ